MEGQIRSYIRLTIKDSGSRQHTSMGSNIYDMIIIMSSPTQYISSSGVYLMVEFRFPRAQASVVNYISSLGPDKSLD
ncbi:hypothetical protein MA16_Dca017766 [Dendrobium catenatum]|uniref:Uncharacterized protein n=1 Tax=Dendrobium catenatum TaxID=906689 RepID=A0A2I0XIG3_9ASPA|nr:hypothetical protein MA16_Dca017766 [Dendrobium catenatum]